MLAVLLIAVLGGTAACSSTDGIADQYGASAARVGESIAVLGWNMSVSNLRWEADHVLVDVDASPSDPAKPYAKPEEIRFGLFGTLSHPIEATGLESCSVVSSLAIQPLSAPTPDRLSGTVCIGPLKEQSAVRGVYVYSPRDRIPNTVAAYPVAFPVGLLPTPSTDTGVLVQTTSVEAWRDDGTPLSQLDLGDPKIFTGNGYMLLGLDVFADAAEYRDGAAQRGGPLMMAVTPTLPGMGLSPACSAYGSSVLVLPDTKLDAARMNASLCAQGEINEAVLYATLSVVGTHAAVWLSRE